MRVYRYKTLLDDDADFGAFTRLYGASVVGKSADPFLLVRDDDARLFIVTADGSVILCVAHAPNDCLVSYASNYSDAYREIAGLSKPITAKDENFVDLEFAIKAIHAFFDHGRMSEYVDFRRGAPEPEIMSFPTAIIGQKRVARELIEMRVAVLPKLQSDMREVCEFLEQVADDPDENIDFGDAIQIGSLCGGRMDRRRDTYLFSYYLDNGDVWSFRVPRIVLEGIADGSIEKLTVKASVPKETVDRPFKSNGDTAGE